MKKPPFLEVYPPLIWWLFYSHYGGSVDAHNVYVKGGIKRWEGTVGLSFFLILEKIPLKIRISSHRPSIQGDSSMILLEGFLTLNG